ncbi:MAG: hypothetical protein KA436_06910, partial [Oligoflexales bacterium]|nr:hypothetical protein [Oligoflexales bacterium]
AVFSLSVGEAVLLTYGSYSKREESLLVSGAGIAFFDTLSALLAGFIIFPALFAFNLDPNQQGMGLTFNIMPSLFVQMSWGRILGPAFFILLVFAALTTTVALFEIPVVYLTEARGYDRPRAVNRVGLASFLISIPIALSKGAHPWLSELSVPYFEAHKGLYEIFDFFCGSLGMLFGGFFICLFVGWVWGKQAALEEVRAGSPLLTRHPKLAQIWFLHIKYIIPPVILLLLVFL